MHIAAQQKVPVWPSLLKECRHEVLRLIKERIVPSMGNARHQQIGTCQLSTLLPYLLTHPSTAFGVGPIKVPIYEGDLDLHGQYTVTHHSAQIQLLTRNVLALTSDAPSRLYEHARGNLKKPNCTCSKRVGSWNNLAHTNCSKRGEYKTHAQGTMSWLTTAVLQQACC